MKNHQGFLVSEWITKNHDSVNKLADKIAADAPPAKRANVKSSAVNLLGRSIPHHEFLAPQWHRKWNAKIAPFTGYSLEQVIKEMEKSTEISGMDTEIDYKEQYLIYKSRYELLMSLYESEKEKRQ